MTKEDYMRLPKERLAEILAERDEQDRNKTIICIQLDQKKLTKVEVLLQIGAMMSITVLYGLGVIGCFLGIYNT